MSDITTNTTSSDLVTKNSLTSILKNMLKNLKDGQLESWLPFSWHDGSNTSLNTSNPNEVAFGSHNKSDQDTLFSIGCGVEGSPKNAFEIKSNGDMYIDGELYEKGESYESIKVDFINELK